ENQERVADAYVASRYGSWSAALAFWNANGWY
ncbi:peptidoglycan-binding protein LysM, partial [Pediococcus acidilactici]